MNIILRKVKHIPAHLRSTYEQIRYVTDGLIEASRDALVISRLLRNTHIEGEQVGGVAVVNAARCVSVTEIEWYIAHILARNGLTVYMLFDDGVLEHWDSAQAHSFKYHSPYRARWQIKWRRIIRKYMIYAAFRPYGIKMLNYSDIVDGTELKRTVKPSDVEYATSSTERFYETVPVDVEGVHQDYYRKSLRNSVISRHVANYVLEELHPDLYVTSHGIYSVWGPAYRTIKEADIPVVVYQVAGTTKGKIRLVDRHDQALSNTEDWRQFNAATPSDGPETDQGKALIEARLSHNSQDTKEYFGRDLVGKSVDGLSQGERGITFGMFPNVVWDGNIPERDIMFENLVDWCTFTIKAVRGTRHHLYVRFHPSETTRLNGTVQLEGLVRQRIPDVDSLDNVTLISSDEGVDTYQLAREHVDVGLVYDGTLCIELTYMGIPVIACANGNFTPDTIVYQPQSREEYGSYLARSADVLDRFQGERDERISQACKYAYWLFEASLMDFGPLGRPYPAEIDYKRVPRDQPLSRDEQQVSDRLMRPLIDPRTPREEETSQGPDTRDAVEKVSLNESQGLSKI
jgi:hypothetical protein